METLAVGAITLDPTFKVFQFRHIVSWCTGHTVETEEFGSSPDVCGRDKNSSAGCFPFKISYLDVSSYSKNDAPLRLSSLNLNYNKEKAMSDESIGNFVPVFQHKLKKAQEKLEKELSVDKKNRDKKSIKKTIEEIKKLKKTLSKFDHKVECPKCGHKF